MKFLPYVLKHLRRNWIRTTSTIVGIAMCVFLISTLRTVLRAVEWGLQSASATRLVTRHAVSINFNMPEAYKARIEAVPGVRRVAMMNWFGGLRGNPESGEAFKDFFTNMAVDAEPYLAMYPEFEIPPDQRAAFMQEMRACVIGRGLAERFGWKVGDTFQLESFIPPYRKGSPFEFVVRAIYDVDKSKYPGFDDSLMLFHRKYLDESVKRRAAVGHFSIEIANPDKAAEISRTIDAAFENSDTQTKTMTEGAFAAEFVSMAGNMALLLNAIGLAVTFTILLVTANTMSMAIRERRKEIAVLKTLGFPSGLVMGLVLGEAVTIGALGGAAGLLLSWAVLDSLTNVPYLGAIVGGFPDFGLTVGVALLGFGISLLVGFAAGIGPATLAYRARVTEMLRQV